MKVYKPGTDCEVELNIFANERSCQEYILPNHDSEPNATVCFIPVDDDARITVQGTFSGSVLHGQMDVLADGTFVASRSIEDLCSKEGILKCWEKRRVDVKTFLHVPDPHDHKPRLRPKVAEGNLVAKRLPRKELSGILHGGDEATGIGVGSITLAVSLNQDVFDTRGGEGEPHYPSVTLGTWRDRVADVADSSIEPELEMKMEVFPDSNPVKDKRANLFWRDLRAARPGTEPWAYFIFYYRSQAAIDAAGGVPLSEPKALPADGGMFIRACDQEMVPAQKVIKSPSPPPAPEVKKKMGLGQALILPGSQPARDSGSQRSSSGDHQQQQHHVNGTPDAMPLSWTPPPTSQEVRETATCLMAALTDEEKTRLRNEAMRSMNEQQRQQATAMNKDPLLQHMMQKVRQDIMSRGISAGQHQQNTQFANVNGTNMSSSVESEKDRLFGSPDKTKVKVEFDDEKPSDSANFDLAPPLEHPIFSSKHVDTTSVFQTPKNRVTFSDPLTIGSAKELGSTMHAGKQVDDLAPPPSPLFEPQTSASKSSQASSTSPTPQPANPIKSALHLPPCKRPISQLNPTNAVPSSPPPAKRPISQLNPTNAAPASASTSASPTPAKRPISQLNPTNAVPASASTSTSPTPAKRPISQLDPADSAPASTSASMSPSPAKRLRNDEMLQRKARLEAEIRAKREHKAAIKKANEEQAAHRQRQEQLWVEEDAKRRAEEEEEERRRIAEEEEEARKADEAFAAEMEALERENDMEGDDVDREIEEGERQRAKWEERMRARGFSELR